MHHEDFPPLIHRALKAPSIGEALPDVVLIASPSRLTLVLLVNYLETVMSPLSLLDQGTWCVVLLGAQQCSY